MGKVIREKFGHINDKTEEMIKIIVKFMLTLGGWLGVLMWRRGHCFIFLSVLLLSQTFISCITYVVPSRNLVLLVLMEPRTER